MYPPWLSEQALAFEMYPGGAMTPEAQDEAAAVGHVRVDGGRVKAGGAGGGGLVFGGGGCGLQVCRKHRLVVTGALPTQWLLSARPLALRQR